MTTEIEIDTLIEWRLHPVMSERKIRRATDLKRLLEKEGIFISSSQLSRLVYNTPSRLSLEVFAGLMRVLKCDASDLIRLPSDTSETNSVQPRLSEARQMNTPKKRSRPSVKQRNPDESAEDITGPKVSAFPIPERDK